MTLSKVKELLDNNGISYDCAEYENESKFLSHIVMFPATIQAEPHKIASLVIRSDNGKTNIELMFQQADDLIFEELYFGEYSFELFDIDEALTADQLISNIKAIMDGSLAFICANDLKHRRWLGDACYDLRDGRDAYEAKLQKIQKPKGFPAKLTRSKKQYEIYDWNTYRCVIK